MDNSLGSCPRTPHERYLTQVWNKSILKSDIKSLQPSAKSYALAIALFCYGSLCFPLQLAQRIMQATFSYDSGSQSRNPVAQLSQLGASSLHFNQTYPRHHLSICANVSTVTPLQSGCLEKTVSHIEKSNLLDHTVLMMIITFL